MSAQTRPDARDKALAVNLDSNRYGTFAEIGAGQEVVRWFFRVGGAAGTVAKSISAYDMAVSDAIYGPSERYVSRERLESMLDYEYDLTHERLQEARGNESKFFAFADTVRARGYRGTGECFAWMGIKFQAYPRDEPSRIILHVRLLDEEATAQQEALGIVGVNLVYGASELSHDPDQLVESLLDDLSTDRIEIDMIELSGIQFRNVDNRAVSLKLVQLGLAGAAMFDSEGTVLQVSEALRKKPVLVARGSFRPVTKVNIDMLESGCGHFRKQLGGEDPMVLAEITMSNLRAQGDVDLRDFLERADVLAATGHTVLISDYGEYFRLASYLRRHTSRPIALLLGAGALRSVFDERYYEALEGGILESMGRLFRNDLRLLVYPLRETGREDLTTVYNLDVPADLHGLYEYLVAHDNIQPLHQYKEELLDIFSRDVLDKIDGGDPTWREMVPPAVAEIIERRRCFGYR